MRPTQGLHGINTGTIRFKKGALSTIVIYGKLTANNLITYRIMLHSFIMC